MADRAYEVLRDELVPSIGRLITHAFAGTAEASEQWIREAGVEQFRVVREKGRLPEACVLHIPMGQYFGGRSVPMIGIAGVAVAPESRGKGLARWMMLQSLQEAAAAGAAISTLYASTPSLYRQVGYETAGHRFVSRFGIASIDAGTREPGVRPITDHDEEHLRNCYTIFAQRFNGTLDRGEYCWRRTRKNRDVSYQGFGVEGDNGLDGYIFINQVRDAATGDHDVAVSDAAFVNGRAARRLLGFLADFATMGREALVFGSPLHPLLAPLGDRHISVTKKDYWMLRILNAAKAIESRGYARHVQATLQIDLRDPMLSANDGSWTVRVEHGRATARKESTARPAIRCDARGLAAVWSGLYTASQAALLGWVEGDEAALHTADSIFAEGGTPWMADMF